MQISLDDNYNIKSIVTNLDSKIVFNNSKLFDNFCSKYLFEFIDLQFMKAEELLQYQYKYDINLGCDFFFIKHDKGTAMINIECYYKDSIRIFPAIDIVTSNFISGWSFYKGYYSNVSIDLNSSKMIIKSDISRPEQNLLLLWLCEKMEREFYNFIKENSNEDKYRKFRGSMYTFRDSKYYFLNKLIYDYLQINRNKRIDLISINNKTVKDYIIDNKISKFNYSSKEIIDISLKYKKPCSQVINYIRKNGI